MVGGFTYIQTLHSVYQMVLSNAVGRFRRSFSEVPLGGIVSRGGRIRTYDLLYPKQTRCQAALHPVGSAHDVHERFRSGKLILPFGSIYS